MKSRLLDEVKNHFLSEIVGESLPSYKHHLPEDSKPQSIDYGSSVDMLCIDVSLSMDETDYPPSRLEAAKKACYSFFRELKEKNPSAFIGIVVFGEDADVISYPLRISEHSMKLKNQIQQLTSLPWTNTAAGLTVSGQVLIQYNTSHNPRILLLTDGHANKGENPELVADKLKSNGIELDIIGIGGSPADVNEHQLKRMASVVNGDLRYWFIRNVGELIRKFQTLALRELK